LNKYAYAANNPLSFKDPDGRDVVVLFEEPQKFRSPGHPMLFAHNPVSGQAAIMSFGPADTSLSTRAFQLPGGPVSSTKTFMLPATPDELRKSYAALSIQTTPEEAQDVINFIVRFSTTENLYRLYDTNCTTVVIDALKAIGILPPDYGSIVPGSFWSSLYSRHASPSKTRYSIMNRFDYPHLIIDSRPGVDYGNPRFGMNTFDFIMLMLRPQRVEIKVRMCYTGPDGKQVCP
jgi:hypothetical protein